MIASRCQAATQQQQITTSSAPRSRAYPDEPRVGVGVVVFRKPVTIGQAPEVLLIRRAKEPAKGQWCFPGGSLELGETLASCAVREVMEETGVQIRNNQGVASVSSEGFSKSLQQPTPFAAVDSINPDDTGRLKFHYVVVEATAMAADPQAQPVASDDVDAVQWLEVHKLRSLDNLTRNCARLAEEACERFDLGS
ncbi:hypothetical protein OEZ86_001160 [Tetradesmus obliquus]|nr:hypothetical protein OEZ86_001160 [Tetradesmus obliquus]